MAFGEIAKQLAQQALADQVNPKPAAAALPDTVAAIMIGQVQAMQKACKDDEELVVLVRSGSETIRVMEFIVPAWEVLVLAGLDEARNTTRVVTAPESVQLVCKVMKTQPGAKPIRIAFRAPKPKAE